MLCCFCLSAQFNELTSLLLLLFASLRFSAQYNYGHYSYTMAPESASVKLPIPLTSNGGKLCGNLMHLVSAERN